MKQYPIYPGPQYHSQYQLNSISSSGALLSGKKQKNKRRSKNDQEGRNHKCTLCDKTYLSYPALYTHLKTKHADAKGADG